mmetsp:Transcript_43200/g.77581  ORF Transcript_43200/g.77581 Transcript_43200/m.77581 type:complete len:85 (+) Transcript_43200:159-413(+)
MSSAGFGRKRVHLLSIFDFDAVLAASASCFHTGVGCPAAAALSGEESSWEKGERRRGTARTSPAAQMALGASLLAQGYEAQAQT